VRLWNPIKGLQVNTYRGNGGDVRGLAVAADNRTFLSCGTDRLVNHFDVATGAVIRRFSGHDAAVNAVQFAANESLAVSTSYDATVRFWDMKSRSTRPIDMVKAASDSITGLAVPVDTPLVVTGAVDGTVTVLDVRKGALVKDDLHVPVSCVAVPADALYVIAACTDSAIRLLDRAAGGVLGKYEGHVHKDFHVECGLLCEDAVVVSGSEDGACAAFPAAVMHMCPAHQGTAVIAKQVLFMSSCAHSEGTRWNTAMHGNAVRVLHEKLRNVTHTCCTVLSATCLCCFLLLGGCGSSSSASAVSCTHNISCVCSCLSTSSFFMGCMSSAQILTMHYLPSVIYVRSLSSCVDAARDETRDAYGS
jgi:hypothetical protein